MSLPYVKVVSNDSGDVVTCIVTLATKTSTNDFVGAHYVNYHDGELVGSGHASGSLDDPTHVARFAAMTNAKRSAQRYLDQLRQKFLKRCHDQAVTYGNTTLLSDGDYQS